MTRMRRMALLAVAAAGVLCGCKLEPDVSGRRDIGFTRPERSGEAMVEQSGPPGADTTTPASARQRQAADALASGKGQAAASAPTPSMPPGPG